MQLPSTQLVILAKADAIRFGIPESVYQAFRSHVHNCLRRRIEMKFTLPEWWAWWQIDGRWAKRGVKQGCVVMARFNDAGPYAADNVYCATIEQNQSDVPHAKRSAAVKASFERRRLNPSWKSHLAVRGDGHPCSRAVITPRGRFGSAALAAEEYDIERQTAARWARDRLYGWRYEAEGDRTSANTPEGASRGKSRADGRLVDSAACRSARSIV